MEKFLLHIRKLRKGSGAMSHTRICILFIGKTGMFSHTLGSLSSNMTSQTRSLLKYPFFFNSGGKHAMTTMSKSTNAD